MSGCHFGFSRPRYKRLTTTETSVIVKRSNWVRVDNKRKRKSYWGKKGKEKKKVQLYGNRTTEFQKKKKSLLLLKHNLNGPTFYLGCPIFAFLPYLLLSSLFNHPLPLLDVKLCWITSWRAGYRGGPTGERIPPANFSFFFCLPVYLFFPDEWNTDYIMWKSRCLLLDVARVDRGRDNCRYQD